MTPGARPSPREALARIEGLREHSQRQGTWGIEYGDDRLMADVLRILNAALPPDGEREAAPESWLTRVSERAGVDLWPEPPIEARRVVTEDGATMLVVGPIPSGQVAAAAPEPCAELREAALLVLQSQQIRARQRSLALKTALGALRAALAGQEVGDAR